MRSELAPCLGCGTEIPMTPTTQTAKGLICPMCQTQDSDPVQDFERRVATAKAFGVPKEAKVGKPLWGYRNIKEAT